MTEQQLQSKIVVWFSQTFPDKRGCLFLQNNDVIDERSIFLRILKRNKWLEKIVLPHLYKIKFLNKALLVNKNKALGQIKGLSDLGHVTSGGVYCGIELKAPGSRHNSDHVRNQIEWGEMVQKSGGFYIISSDEDEIKSFIKQPYHFDLNKIKGRLNKSTILF